MARSTRSAVDTDHGETSAIWQPAPRPAAVLVLAHGAGGTMETPFLTGFADALVARGISVLRFNFLYAHLGRKAPDVPAKLHAAWRAAFAHAQRRAEEAPVFAGGKSLGGRIASMCVADGMPAKGLVFLGYPLHPPGKPDQLRAAHLGRIEVPMLWLQGTRDPFATAEPLHQTLQSLGDRAEVFEVQGGDHSFRTRKKDPPWPTADVRIGAALAEPAAAFILRHVSTAPRLPRDGRER